MEENQAQNEQNSEQKSTNTATSGRGKKPTGNIGALFGLFMIAIYFSMAYLTLCTDFFFWIIDWARYGLGTIFIVYGLWRGYRYFKNK